MPESFKRKSKGLRKKGDGNNMDGFLRFICDEQDILINKSYIVDVTLAEASIFNELDSYIIIINTIKDKFIIKLDEIKILHKFNYSFNVCDLGDLFPEKRSRLCDEICNNQGIDEWICDCGNSNIRSIYESLRICNDIVFDDEFCVVINKKDK